jgi:hypothetical protein
MVVSAKPTFRYKDRPCFVVGAQRLGKRKHSATALVVYYTDADEPQADVVERWRFLDHAVHLACGHVAVKCTCEVSS